MNVTEGIKKFGRGGRLYADAREEHPAGQPAAKPAADPSAKPLSRRPIYWRDLATTAVEIAGVAAVAYGAYQIYQPAGWLVGGAAAVALGVAAGVDR